MTREEEIMQEANTRYSVSHPFIDITKESFIEGSQWADKTMIEKACEWLKDELYDVEDNTQRGGFDIRSKCYFTSEDLIEHFKKAMEDEV